MITELKSRMTAMQLAAYLNPKAGDQAGGPNVNVTQLDDGVAVGLSLNK